MTKKIRFRPTGDRVVLKLDPTKTKTDSGLLFIPECAQDTELRATVLAVGKGVVLGNGRWAGSGLKVGETVRFKQWAPNRIDIKIDDQEVTILPESQITCVED